MAVIKILESFITLKFNSLRYTCIQIDSYSLLKFPNSYEKEQLFPIPVCYKKNQTAVHKKK